MRKKVRVKRATEKEGKKSIETDWPAMQSSTLEMHLPVMERRPCSACQIRVGLHQIQLFPTRKWGEDGVGGWIELNILQKGTGERKRFNQIIKGGDGYFWRDIPVDNNWMNLDILQIDPFCKHDIILKLWRYLQRNGDLRFCRKKVRFVVCPWIFSPLHPHLFIQSHPHVSSGNLAAKLATSEPFLSSSTFAVNPWAFSPLQL